MIDIHSHILYDIDDGSESLDMSLQMLRMSVDSGVTDIIATPHVNRQGHIPAWQTILDKVAALQEEADKAQIPIRIYTGAEVELNGDTLRFMKENHDDYCLAGSRYVMLELTDQSQPDIVEKMIYELQMRGFLPLLAHVERYERLMERPETLLAWMGRPGSMQYRQFHGLFRLETAAARPRPLPQWHDPLPRQRRASRGISHDGYTRSPRRTGPPGCQG